MRGFSRLLSCVLVVGLVGACGSTAGPSATPALTAGSTPRPPDNPDATPPRPSDATPGPTSSVAASFVAGEVEYRVVNLRQGAGGDSGEPVDVYVRTDGLVQAFLVASGLAYGDVSDGFAPPAGGSVVVTTAGAADAECVATCPHIIATASSGLGEGDDRTLILYADGALELWHAPDPASVGTTGNALAPADPTTALLYVVGVALRDADFGLRLAFEGEPGCQMNRTSDSILVGGNQVAVFAFDGAADVLMHDSTDTECADTPVGGPFPVSGEPGSRTLLVLAGEPGEMVALDLEL